MKKLNILLYLFCFITFSCKSDIEKQNELTMKQSDSIFAVASENISLYFIEINVDSINNAYKEINVPNKRLFFAKRLEQYTKKEIHEIERIAKIANAETKAENNLEKQKVNKEWSNSKAGKLQKKHPDWTDEECMKVVDKKIWIGMTYDMLLYQRGKPSTVNPSNYGNGTQYQCCWDKYSPSCFYMKEDNIIYSYN